MTIELGAVGEEGGKEVSRQLAGEEEKDEI
jgi:hypothetical protein